MACTALSLGAGRSQCRMKTLSLRSLALSRPLLAVLLLVLPLLGRAQFVVSSTSPAANAGAVPRSGSLSLTFNQPVSPGTTGNVRVFSAQRGGQLVNNGGASVSGGGSSPSIAVDLSRSLQPGETVQVSVPATVQNSAGTGATPYAYQLTAAVATGGGTFGAAATTYKVGSPVVGIAVGDLNGDGVLDLVTADYNGNATAGFSGGDVSVALGVAGAPGTFGTPVLYGSSRPRSLALGDVDDDGKLDIVVSNTTGGVSVMLNRSTMTTVSFAGSGYSTGATGTSSQYVALGDLNGDGRLDIAVANLPSGGGTSGVSVLFNQAGTPGTFATGVVYALSGNPQAVAVADVNNDGRLDVVAATSSATAGSAGVAVLLQTSTPGVLAAPVQYAASTSFGNVALGDLNNDGRLDVVAASSSANRLLVLLGQVSAPGTFGPAATYVLGNSPGQVVLGDVNGDGRPDAVVSSSNGDKVVNVLLQAGTPGTFAATTTYPAPNTADNVALADVNGDGRLDIAVGGGNTDAVLLNVAPPPTIASFDQASRAVGQVLVLNGTNLTGATSVRFGELPAPAGSFSANPDGTALTVTVPRLASTNTISVTTPGGTALSPAALTVTRASNSYTFTSAGNLQSDGSPLNVGDLSAPTVTDLDGNGRLDLLVGKSDGTVLRYEQTAAGSPGFTAGTALTTTGGGTMDVGAYSAPTVTDLDGNGRLDLLVGNYDGTVLRYEQTAAGSLSFTAGTTLQSTGGGTMDVGSYSAPTVTDLDGDGLLDLLVGNYDGTLTRFEQVAVGSLSFTAAVVLTTSRGSNINEGYYSAPTVTDLDGDGLLDLVIGRNNGPLAFYEQPAAHSASFDLVSPAPPAIASISFTKPVVTDLDGDGRLDILVGSYDGTVARYVQAPPAPTITDFTPKTGAVSTTTVTLTGTNLTGATSVRFGELPAPAGSFSVNADGTALSVTVPRLASTQKISVTTPGGAALTATAFAVTRASASLVFNPVGNVQDATATDLNADVYSKPALADLDGNGRLDLLVGNRDGNVLRYEQTAANAVTFTALGRLRSGDMDLDVVVYAAPTLTDLDGNGLLDLLVGNNNGNVLRYEQTAASAVTFTAKGNLQSNGTDLDVGDNAVPTVTDLDGNGRLDLLVGNDSGNTKRYEQTAVNATSFGYVADVQANGPTLNVGSAAAPTLTDLDGNGRLDLLVGNAYGSLVLTEQVAAASTTFGPTSDLRSSSGPIRVQQGNRTAPVVTDLDGDGRLDILVGNYNGTVARYVQAASLAVTSISPAANDPAASGSSPVVVSFNHPLTAGSAAALKVFSSQRGGLRTAANPAVVSNSFLRFAPGTAFRAGETVNLTVTTAATGTTGEALARGYVAQFTVAASGPNAGTGNFQPGAEVGAGGSVSGAAVGDVNNDGNPDLVTTNSDSFSGTAEVRLGDGLGGFGASSSTVALAAGVTAVVLGDVDGNGTLDLVASYSNFGGSGASIRLGSGTGTFAGSQSVAVGNGARSVALGDVDGDGDLDLVTANSNDNTVSVRLNTGGGTFATTGQTVAVGSQPRRVLLADVDNDGALDLLTANYGGTVSVRRNDGSGIFAPTGQDLSPGGSSFTDLAVGDVDADGDLDLAVSADNAGLVRVRFNTGGTFASTGQDVGIASAAAGVAFADVDSDSDLDLVAADAGSGNQVSLRRNDGGGTFAATGPEVAVGANPQSPLLADVDNDGDLDLLTVNGPTSGLSVRLNVGPPTIISFTPQTGPVGTTPVVITGTNLGGTTSVRFGELPAVFTVVSPTELRVTVPVLASTQRISVTTPGGAALTATAFAVTRAAVPLKFVLAGNLQSQLNGGPLGDINVAHVAKPVLADLDGNGRLDLLVGDGGGLVTRYEQASAAAITFADLGPLQDGSGTAIQVPGATPRAAPAVTDLDGNGRLDLLVGTTAGDVRRYEQTSAGAATFADLGPLAGVTVGVAATPTVTDLDGNGRLDLLVGNYDGLVTRFEQAAPNAGSFGAGTVVAGVNVYSFAAPTVTDLDGNGRLDLLVGNNLSIASSLARYEQDAVGSGTFTNLGELDQDLPRGRSDFAPVVTDLDGDGNLDLLVGDNDGFVQLLSLQTVVVALSPAANANAVPAGTALTATYSLPIAGTAASLAQVRAFGDQAGQRAGAGTTTASGSTVSFVPSPALRPNETLRLTLPAGTVRSVAGAPAAAYVWQVLGAATSGTATFANGSDPATGRADAVALADVDRDGTLDLLVAAASGSAVQVRRGLGAGVYAATASPVAVAFGATHLRVADLDADGYPDFVTDSRTAAGLQQVSVALNGGAASPGTFTVSLLDVGDVPRDVQAADFDADGDLDLAVLAGGADLNVYFNDGSGTFDNAVYANIGLSSAQLLVSGDWNRDGRPDLAVTNPSGSLTTWYFNEGRDAGSNLNFTLGGSLSSTAFIFSSAYALTTADVTGDGRLDLLVSFDGPSGPQVSVQVGTAAGGFQAGAALTVSGTYARDVQAADLDADGDLDLVLAGSNGPVRVLLNTDGTGSFPLAATAGTGYRDVLPSATYGGLALADVNNDGAVDFAVGTATGPSAVRLNAPVLLPTVAALNPTAGALDAAISGTGTALLAARSVVLAGVPAAFVAQTDGQLSFAVPRQATSGRLRVGGPGGVTVGPAFTVTRPSNSLLLPAAPNLGTGSGAALVDAGSYSAPAVADLDGDGLLDLLLATSAGTVARFAQTAPNAATFAPAPTGGGASNLRNADNTADLGVPSGSPAITDLDGDGLLDLLVGDGAGQLHRFEQTGAHTFTFADLGLLTDASGTALDVGDTAAPTVGDVDNDGLLDLLVGNFDGQVRRYEQTALPAATFADLGLLTTDGSTVLDAGTYAHPVLTDLDGDNLLDLLVGTETNNLRRYEQPGAGSARFGAATAAGDPLTTDGSTPAGAYYAAPVVTDVDGDGLLDVLVGNFDGEVQRFEQQVGAPLPVQLVSFTATAQGAAAVQLAWTTASELNSAYFAVERSPDGVAFAPIGQVAGAGSKATRTNYRLLDASLPAGATTLYYRLRQIDLDNTTTYSSVRHVTVGGAGGLAVFPNPTQQLATLTGAEPGTPVLVLDALGRQVARTSADAAGVAHLALPPGLATGVYTVRAGLHSVRLTIE